MLDRLVAQTITLAESGHLSDSLVRLGMRGVVARRLQHEDRTNPGTAARAEQFASGPMVVAAGAANDQHYEVPAAFFEVVLGPRLKYSACSWRAASDLAAAEVEMLELSAQRAAIEDGQRILDLGCGWGSFSLWLAARCPGSRIVAVSNSSSQRDYIRAKAGRSRLTNVDVVSANVSEFSPDRTFDRIVSIEMLEHVRNHRHVFQRAAEWLVDAGKLFVHVFAHARHAYPYEVRSPSDWMAAQFFTGGMMPSRALLPLQAAPWFDLEGQCSMPGLDYQRTLDAWLANLDANRREAMVALEAAGELDSPREVQRWRMFFMACSELFGYHDGTEWGVEHYLFTRS